MSQIKFEIKKKKVPDLSDGTKHYFQRKYKNAQEKLKQKLSSAAAPGQSFCFIRIFINASDKSFLDSDIDDIPNDLESLLKI